MSVIKKLARSYWLFHETVKRGCQHRRYAVESPWTWNLWNHETFLASQNNFMTFTSMMKTWRALIGYFLIRWNDAAVAHRRYTVANVFVKSVTFFFASRDNRNRFINRPHIMWYSDERRGRSFLQMTLFHRCGLLQVNVQRRVPRVMYV